MRLVIVTGMSGAGKTTALKDPGGSGILLRGQPAGASSVEKFAELHEGQSGRQTGKRSPGNRHPQRRGAASASKGRDPGNGGKTRTVPCYDPVSRFRRTSVLIKRYKETRRSHPLSGVGRLERGIALEREKLSFLKEEADYILDTSRLLWKDLRRSWKKSSAATGFSRTSM